MKKCIKCQIEKEESEFHKKSNNKDGLNTVCKECRNKYYEENKEKLKEYKKEYYEENKEKIKLNCDQYREKNKDKIKEHKKLWAEQNREKLKEKKKKYCEENKDKIKENKKRYREQNKEKIKENKKEYYEKNKDKIKEYKKLWSEQNREKVRERKRKYCKRKYQEDVFFKLRSLMSSCVRNTIRKNGSSKENISIHEKLDYTILEFKEHFENHPNWKPWMNWKNHGNYDPNRRTWQIDHIKPHSLFHYTDMDCQDFKDCWALSNLQPLDALENIKKGNKYNGD